MSNYNAETLLAALPEESRRLCADILTFPVIHSTNRYLLEHADLPSGTVCLADEQTHGRGRRGRQWVAPAGTGLTMSLLWRFPLPLAALSGLNLAIGVAVARALVKLGVKAPALKWPNDMLWQGKKLAGVLQEVGKHSDNETPIVIGIGLNVMAFGFVDRTADINHVTLQTILGKAIDLNTVAAAVLSELLPALKQYEEEKAQPFIADWQRWDYLQGQSIRVFQEHACFDAIASGINAQGHLLVEYNGQQHALTSADVSVRRQGDL